MHRAAAFAVPIPEDRFAWYVDDVTHPPNAPRIACVGNIVMDAVATPVDVLPAEGNMAVFDRLEWHLGGCGANVAAALARLGIPVGLHGAVGADFLGDACVRELASLGIDTRGVRREAASATSFSFVMVASGGERRILTTLGANAGFAPEEPDAFDGAAWLFVGGLSVMPRLEGEALADILQRARARGTRTAADTATNDRFDSDRWERLIGPAYPYLDVFFPSQFEAEQITGRDDPLRACEQFRDRGVRVAGVKLGARGCVLLSDGGALEVPAWSVPCVQSLGAGDCFMAGLLARLSAGASLSDAAAFANAVGACCVRSVGATAGVLGVADTLDAMARWTAGRP